MQNPRRLTFHDLDEDTVFHELNRFANGAKTKDDITLVIIKLQEPSAGREDWEI